MNSATISADVISYTALSEPDKMELEEGIKKLIGELSVRFKKHSFFGRMVQGDYIECAMKNPKYSLRIALLLKTFIKSIEFSSAADDQLRPKYFAEHGIRLAVAVAPLIRLDPKNGIIDGEAIYLSGRAIKSLSTSDKQKIVIKNTMFFCSRNNKLQEQFDALFSLLDTLLSKCSAKQCEVVYYKLLDFSEKEIAEKLERYQSTISQHSTAAGWLSIEKAINYYEKTIL